jgi:hypothetical protein
MVVALAGAPLLGQEVTLTPVDDRSGQDGGGMEGAKDGTFDTFLTDGPSLVVVDNGFVDIRAAIELDVSALAGLPLIARLVLSGGSDEGSRQIEVHGYTSGANGVIGLDDFAHDGLQATSGPLGDFNSILTLDVTPIVNTAVGAAATYVGFNVREVGEEGIESILFGSRNGLEVSRPRLEIFYNALFLDGFESGDVGAWSSGSP